MARPAYAAHTHRLRDPVSHDSQSVAGYTGVWFHGDPILIHSLIHSLVHRLVHSLDPVSSVYNFDNKTISHHRSTA